MGERNIILTNGIAIDIHFEIIIRKNEGGNDAFGFGAFPGQYGFVLLSRYPIDHDNIRSFQKFLWRYMPDANLPVNDDSTMYYSSEALDVLRLSSKNHVDIPLIINGKKIHILAAHPTPPVFDGPEDRNGKRNYDEIRLLADYISGADYIKDDLGKVESLGEESFFVMGDMNADPHDGDSYMNAITQLLDHPMVNKEVARGKFVPVSLGGVERSKNKNDTTSLGNPAYDTSHWGLRVDYVLPSKDLKVDSSGVFWPMQNDSLSYLMERNAASDHLLVWVDIVFDGK